MATDLEEKLAEQEKELEELRPLVPYLEEVEGQRDRLQALIEDLESDLSAVQQELHDAKKSADHGAAQTGSGGDRELANLRVRYKALAEQFEKIRGQQGEMQARISQLEGELAEATAARDRMASSMAATQEQARRYEREVAELQAKARA